MKGLILNDLYSMKKNFKAYALVFAVFAAVTLSGEGNIFMVFYMVFFAVTIPMNLMGLDENSRWNVYCGTLPCTKRQIVLSKYIIGLVSEIIAVIIAGVSYAVGMIRGGVFDAGTYSAVMAASLAVSLIFISVSLPFLFRFGALKGRMFMIIMICAVCGAFCSIGVAASKNGSISGGMLEMYLKIQNVWALPAAFAVGLIIYALSLCISSAIYNKREIV